MVKCWPDYPHRLAVVSDPAKKSHLTGLIIPCSEPDSKIGSDPRILGRGIPVAEQEAEQQSVQLGLAC